MMPYDQQTERPQQVNTFQSALNRLVAQALAERSLQWFSAVGSLGVWTWAVIHPEPLRIAAAAGYSLLCHVAPLFRSKS